MSNTRPCHVCHSCALLLLGTWSGAAASIDTDYVLARATDLNNALLRLHEVMQRAQPDEAAHLRSRAVTIIEQRAAALSALIAQDARRALTVAFSPELLADFAAKFPQSARLLETHSTWLGPYEYWIADSEDLKSYRSVRKMKVGDQTIEVHFAVPEPEGIKSGDLLEVSGVLAANRLAVEAWSVPGTTLAAGRNLAGSLPKEIKSGDALRAAKIGSVQATVLATTASACSTTGVQNTAVLLVTFPGVLPPSTVTPQSVHDIFFGTTGRSLDGYWREASYGQTSAAGRVYGWYTLNSSYTCSQLDAARDAAIALAASDGANFQQITRVFIIYPDIGCTAGFATVGCTTLNSPAGPFTASTAYLVASYMLGDQGVELVTHEAGHNLGLLHAGTLASGTEVLGPISAPGTVNEVGDFFSSVGGWSLGLYSAPHKAEVLGWMALGTNYQVVPSSGTYSLQPIETSPPGLQTLKVQRGTGNDAWLWVEYRQPIGNYDSTLYHQPFSGALIHYQDATTGAFTRLLDFTRQTGEWTDPALVAGQSWSDPYSNLSISVQSATPSALTLAVSYRAVPCTRANPAVTIAPSNPSVNSGSSVNYTVSVTNNDTAGCSSSTFNLSSGQPPGWPTTFSLTSLVLSPGQTGSVTMNKTAPPGTAAATYTVNASATSGSYAGWATANCTVTAPALAVSLSMSAPTYRLRQAATATAMVTYGTSAAAGASVTFTMTEADGSRTGKTVTADSTGKATWSYKLGPKDPKGAYSCSAQATYNSQTATSNTATFTVQ